MDSSTAAQTETTTAWMKADMKAMVEMMELWSEQNSAVKTAGGMVKMMESLSAVPYTHKARMVSLGLPSEGRHTRWIQQELKEVSSWWCFGGRVASLTS